MDFMETAENTFDELKFIGHNHTLMTNESNQ